MNKDTLLDVFTVNYYNADVDIDITRLCNQITNHLEDNIYFEVAKFNNDLVFGLNTREAIKQKINTFIAETGLSLQDIEHIKIRLWYREERKTTYPIIHSLIRINIMDFYDDILFNEKIKLVETKGILYKEQIIHKIKIN